MEYQLYLAIQDFQIQLIKQSDLMQKPITFIHKNIRKQFIVSNKTKPNTLKRLVKKALHLQSQIKYLRSNGHRQTIQGVIYQSRGGQYEVILDEQSSEDRSKSQVCSQKNMSKVSGRKNPPSQNELLDSKFYIDDFQLFMSQVTSKKSNKLFGIVFFNSKKKASFLGKKILRELIFEFDKIQFFYALHPIKMHTSSALLGDVLVFSLFRGKKMIHENEFPQQITAADEIPNYIKSLIKAGNFNLQESQNQQKRPKNLIHVHQQRSFDHKIENSPQKLSDFANKPNRTAELINIKPLTPQRYTKNKQILTNQRPQIPMKSQITNQISFQKDFCQQEWFFQSDHLTRLQKGILSAMIKQNDHNLLAFINGLSMKDSSKQKLNIKLMKVFLGEIITNKFGCFNDKQLKMIEHNQQNRKSFVFNALLKLHRFGDIKEFIETITKGLLALQQSEKKNKETTIIYSTIAKNNDKNKGSFTIKLLDCQNDGETASPRELPSPFRKDPTMHSEHTKIARIFHSKVNVQIHKNILKDVDFGKDYDQAERAGICDLILKNDAFMIQTFIRHPEKSKKLQKMPSKIVKKYLRQIQSRYDQIRQRTLVDAQLNLKMQKLQIFNGLVYYLYKQRIINKKQLKISFYLYTWSDLNILAGFQLYLFDRNIDQFVDTLYSIDYNYYLYGLYEIDHAQVQQFTIEIQSQLIILFLYENYIDSGEERMSLEKFIRAGDASLIKLYTDLSIEKQDLINRMIQLSKIKKVELDNINRNENVVESQIKQKKKDRCNFIDKIVSTRYKTFTKKQLIKYCINNDEPTITAMFDTLDQNNEQMEWSDSFSIFLSKIDQIHMKLIMQQLAREAGIDLIKLKQCKAEIIKGIYEAFMVTGDRSDTIDSLERAVRKGTRVGSPK